MKKRINIFFQSLSIELRNIFVYQFEFWVGVLSTTLIPILVSYLLWKSIYESRGVETMNGFSLSGMVLYYFCITISWKAVFSKASGFIARDIYYGGLNKYLIYPISYLNFKLGEYFAKSLFFYVNLLLFLLFYYFYWGNDLTILSVSKGMILIIFSTIIYYFITCMTEYLTFWVENTWSLAILMRSIVGFGGGVLMPLSFYPETVQNLLHFTPFPFLLYYPVLILLNKESSFSFLENFGVLIFWNIVFFLITRFIWNKGKYQYSGVGI